jgi:hypothetical protein
LRAVPPAAGAAPLPSNDGKKWSPEEVMELLQLVEDENYRRQRLNLDKVSGCKGREGGVGEWGWWLLVEGDNYRRQVASTSTR